jgi:hypothetical protein
MIPVSSSDFAFATDRESLAYLREIVETMMRSFGIQPAECIGRINASWSHVQAVVGENDEIYREMPPYWANHFMYGKESFWWMKPADRERRGMPPLRPLPFPRTPGGA